MTTVDELAAYCKEKQTVGALMLTGEWGCGKTYLIEHDLCGALEDSHEIIRISLFGLDSIDELHAAIRRNWIDRYFQSSVGDLGEKLEKFGKVFAPAAKELVQGVVDKVSPVNINIPFDNIADLIDIDQKLDKKTVVLIFDDLERCKLDPIEVFGCINDYCENRGIKTIVIANEDKLVSRSGDNDRNSNSDEAGKNSKTGKVDRDDKADLSYEIIKEKIVQRTISFAPDYLKIITKIVAETEHECDSYKEFLVANTQRIISLFNSATMEEANDPLYASHLYRGDSEHTAERKAEIQRIKSNKPHNLRTIKYGLQDFYRIYTLLIKENADDIENWLISFLAYMLAVRSGILAQSVGMLENDNIRVLYPDAYQQRYITASIKRWVQTGSWNEDQIKIEIRDSLIALQAQRPVDKVRYCNILDLEDAELREGYQELLSIAYKGELTLRNYINLIINHSVAYRSNISLPEEVDWDLLQNGIKTQFNKLVLSNEKLLTHSLDIERETEKYFSDDERNTYELIKSLVQDDQFGFLRNKSSYIEALRTFSHDQLRLLSSMRLIRFDDEMADVTFSTFRDATCQGKGELERYMVGIWDSNITSREFDTDVSKEAFARLKSDLEDYARECADDKRQIERVHTEHFVGYIENLLQMMSSDSED